MPEFNTIPSAKILRVEDGKVVTRPFQGNLESLGYSVVGSASSEEEVVEQATKLQPDLIPLGILLPEKRYGVEARSDCAIVSSFHRSISLPYNGSIHVIEQERRHPVESPAMPEDGSGTSFHTHCQEKPSGGRESN
jgi:DNA-binding NarL/FixJ family response regulator